MGRVLLVHADGILEELGAEPLRSESPSSALVRGDRLDAFCDQPATLYPHLLWDGEPDHQGHRRPSPKCGIMKCMPRSA